MKLIRCQLCNADRIGPTNEKFPHGAPVFFGHHSSGQHFIVVKCHRCTGAFKMTAAQFNRLPDATVAEAALLTT